MTEPPQSPSLETRDDPAPAPPLQPMVRRGFARWLNAAGFVILAAAIIWVWRNPAEQPDAQASATAQRLTALEWRIAHLEQQPAPPPPDLGPLGARVTALEQRPSQTPQPGPPPDLAPLAARVTALEQRPSQGAQAAAPVDLAPLTARVAALEQHPPQAAPQPDLAPLTARIAALEQRPPPDLAPLAARIAALEARQPADTQLAARLDALVARIDALDAGQRTAQSDTDRRMAADEAHLAAIERSAGQLAAAADRTNRLARILAAQLALDRGQPLGDIPGAPPALARFATAKPPTDAALRLAFPSAARAALAAARPSVEGKPMLTRLWAQAQDLVTIRQGDHVLVGDPAAGVLDRARVALDAGDLAGAVTTVGSLTGPAADVMAGWLTQARSLLDARAALSDWAAHA